VWTQCGHADTPSLSVSLRLMSPKGRNGNHLNQIKMEQNKFSFEAQERNEILQPIIDRLLYLPKSELGTYKEYLKILEELYPIDVQVQNGIRIYNVTKSK